MPTEVFKGVRREVRKRVALQGGKGFTTVSDGHQVADIEVVIDIEQIARYYGPRAMGNRRGRCRFMHGAVTINVLNVKHVKEEK